MLTSLGMWNGGRNLVPLDQLEDDLQLLKCALQIELTMPQVSANILCFVFLWHGGGTWDVCKAPGIGVPPKAPETQMNPYIHTEVPFPSEHRTILLLRLHMIHAVRTNSREPQ